MSLLFAESYNNSCVCEKSIYYRPVCECFKCEIMLCRKWISDLKVFFSWVVPKVMISPQCDVWRCSGNKLKIKLEIHKMWLHCFFWFFFCRLTFDRESLLTWNKNQLLQLHDKMSFRKLKKRQNLILKKRIIPKLSKVSF